MKNPFRFFKSNSKKHDEITQAPVQEEPAVEECPVEEPTETEIPKAEASAPDDGFIEWSRSRPRGGIERRERNDIYEAYSVYGVDADGQLICRFFHRYPEYERDFGMSYSRALSFMDFNKRLLAELDRGDMKLGDYDACIEKAEQLSGAASQGVRYEGFCEEEAAALRDFCEENDTLTDKEYRTGDGIFRCACRSVAGDESLNLWFRKPLCHDALFTDIAGVSRTPIEGYDIDNMWTMGVYNRLRERCAECKVTKLTYDWSLDHETVCLMTAQGFDGIEGTLLLAVADAAVFPRFGFYSLDFSKNANL